MVIQGSVFAARRLQEASDRCSALAVWTGIIADRIRAGEVNPAVIREQTADIRRQLERLEGELPMVLAWVERAAGEDQAAGLL